MTYSIPTALLEETFHHLRECGRRHQECQVLWLSRWVVPELITDVVHTQHRSHALGFELDTAWVTGLWRRLSQEHTGVRCQVHTHPGQAFHSSTDDTWPVIHTAEFLSLVIPNFAVGEASFEGAYLAELRNDGVWVRVDPHERLKVI
jgi:hypothetical protein